MSIELLNGNSYELIKQLKDKSVDLVVTDPPYDFMTKYKSENYGGGRCIWYIRKGISRRVAE
jgi:DNA modification methylase